MPAINAEEREYPVPAGAKVPDWFARKMQEGRPRPNSPHFRYAVSFWAAPLAFDAVITLHQDGTAEIAAKPV